MNNLLKETNPMTAMNGANQPSPKEVTLTRTCRAPRTVVYQAWTDPAQMMRWWGPEIFTCPECRLDPRPGGELYMVMRDPDGVDYPTWGTFEEVRPPERLVFTLRAIPDEHGNFQLETRDTLTLVEENGQTRLTLHVVVLKATPEVAGALAGMEIGWSQSLDKLGQLFK